LHCYVCITSVESLRILRPLQESELYRAQIVEKMRRREFIALMAGSATANFSRKSIAQQSSRPSPALGLMSAPIELAGEWGPMFPRAVKLIVGRMRQACLDGVRLLSDRQPQRIRVELRNSGFPAVWLHRDESDVAWIIVNIGERDWSKLAYQFGHELGHVMANSWQVNAKPGGPSQWLEEAMVEALSLYGLGRLATRWRVSPPFTGDNRFGDALAGYREDIIRRYETLAEEQGLTRGADTWFADHRGKIEASSVAPYGQALSLTILAEYERTAENIEALGALNRWPGRASIPIGGYLRRWEASCAEVQASTSLPTILRDLLRPK
jgi:hypothetical protein